MDASKRDVIERLVVGPSFLILGQHAWADPNNATDVITQLAASSADLEGDFGLESVLSLSSPQRDRFYAELAAAGRNADISASMQRTVAHPWNGVFTTLIDSRVTSAFETEGRRPTAIVGTGDVRNPRSTSELKVRFLFGGVHLPVEDRPPADEFSFSIRSQEAATTLSYLARELVTPRGVIVIEGYRTSDWLSTSQLYPAIVSALPGQVHLFSADSVLRSDPFLNRAIEEGIVVPHAESLSSILDEAEAAGRQTSPAGSDVEARLVRVGGELRELPRDIWNAVVSVARPVDESLLQPFAESSESLAYRRFRAFLGSSEGAPPWQAVASGYAFRREFEHDLEQRMWADATRSEIPEPIILSGQTASGKSTALTSAAVNTAREGSFAVLHVARRTSRPQLASLDRFAVWAEDQGAPATLLLWDGMTDADDYFTMHRQLRARGRRVLIVGTSYLGEGNTSRSVFAPSSLTEAEAARLGDWLSTYGVATTEKDREFIAAHAPFLGALYRLLPDSRRAVERGLNLELRAAEQQMERLSRMAGGDEADDDMTTMALALRDAGLDLPSFTPRENPEEDISEVAFERRSTAEQLTAMVETAGRRGLRVPLELALRVIGREGYESVVEIVRRFDIIRWSEDEAGEQYIGPRNTLEAELLARGDLRDARAEIRVISAFIENLRPRPGNGGPEVEFIVDLMTQIAPDSEAGRRYEPHYLNLVASFKDLRTQPGGSHPRLMLYEANLTRKWVMWAQSGSGPSEERIGLLTDAAQVLDDALHRVDHPRTRLNLLVESAAVLGAIAFERTQQGEGPDTLRDLASQIITRTTEARAIDPENYYPIDVVAWVTIRLASGDSVSVRDRLDLGADALASIVSVDPSQLSSSSRAKYHSRFSQIAALLGDRELERSHLEQLERNDDPAAYFLLALRESGLLEGGFDEEGAARALARLRQADLVVRSDWRCARLMVDLFWLVRTGKRFLQGERQTVAFDAAAWEDCLDVVDQAAGLAEHDRYRGDFMSGLAYFHLGLYQQCNAVFDRLDESTRTLTRRVFSSYLASTPTGNAQVFTGQVRSVRPDGSRGFVWVEEIGTEVPFIPRRFSIDIPQRHDPLPDFHIAFNMRGPYADPIRTTSARTGSNQP